MGCAQPLLDRVASPVEIGRVIDLYFRPTANGRKIRIFLEETGLAYRIVPMATLDGGVFDPAFLRLSPNNKMPVIVDHVPADGGAPLPVFESGAILIYLAEKTGRLLPVAPRPRADVLQWLMWQMAGLGPMSGQNGHFRHQAPDGEHPYARDRYAREVDRLYTVLDHQLAGREFVAGTYSIADIACYPWISGHEVQGLDLASFPDLARWHRHVAGRPAVMRADRDAQDRPSARLWGAARQRQYEQTGAMLRDAYARMGDPGDAAERR